MAVRQRIRRQAKRARPRVRRTSSSSAAGARMDAKQSMSGDGGLMIGGVLDPAEKAADRVADRVMRMPSPGPMVHRKCAECEGEGAKVRRAPAEPDGEETVQAKPAQKSAPVAPGAGAVAASPGAARAIRSMGTGKPLSSAERSFFEPRFGADLSSVRIHDGTAADTATRAVSARAFALGDDIAFAKDEHQPGTDAGRRLLAHELAHVREGAQPNRLVQRLSDPECSSTNTLPHSGSCRSGFLNTCYSETVVPAVSSALTVSVDVSYHSSRPPHGLPEDFSVQVMKCGFIDDTRIGSKRLGPNIPGNLTFSIASVTPGDKYYIRIYSRSNHRLDASYTLSQ